MKGLVMDRYDLPSEKDTPVCLKELVEDVLKDHCYGQEQDDIAYAKIAFAIVRAHEGDKKALKEISDYIQMEHERTEMLCEKYNSLCYKLSNWVAWAVKSLTYVKGN
jgi:hypothetical protein